VGSRRARTCQAATSSTMPLSRHEPPHVAGNYKRHQVCQKRARVSLLVSAGSCSRSKRSTASTPLMLPRAKHLDLVIGAYSRRTRPPFARCC